MPDFDHTSPVPVDWNAELVEQLARHWDEHLADAAAARLRSALEALPTA